MLEVRISCKVCGLERAPFYLSYRGPEESAPDYMRRMIQPAAGDAHFRYSPLCPGTECKLEIKMDDRAPGLFMAPIKEARQ